MIAANIEQAMGYTEMAVLYWAQDPTQNLYTHLQNWENTFVQFNDTVPAERTVRNWKIPTHYVLGKIPNANQDQTIYVSETFRIVYGAVCAANYAAAAGRITAAQRNQVLADWNTYWSF